MTRCTKSTRKEKDKIYKKHKEREGAFYISTMEEGRMGLTSQSTKKKYMTAEHRNGRRD